MSKVLTLLTFLDSTFYPVTTRCIFLKQVLKKQEWFQLSLWSSWFQLIETIFLFKPSVSHLNRFAHLIRKNMFDELYIFKTFSTCLKQRNSLNPIKIKTSLIDAYTYKTIYFFSCLPLLNSEKCLFRFLMSFSTSWFIGWSVKDILHILYFYQLRGVYHCTSPMV